MTAGEEVALSERIGPVLVVLVLAAAGAAAALWLGGDGGAERGPVAWSEPTEVATGPGRVGPWRMNRSDWRYVDDPSVGFFHGGTAGVAWVDQAQKDVFFRRFGSDEQGWPEEPVNVSRSPDVFSWLPRVVVPEWPRRRVYVAWQEIVFSGGTHGGEIFFARSVDGGRSFSEPVNLSETSAGAGKGRMTPRRWHNGSLDLSVAPGGAIQAAWTVYEGGLFVVRSEDQGASFTEPVRVASAGGAGPARAPAVAAGRYGAVHLVWAVGGEAGADLRYARSEDGGESWSGPRRLFPGEGYADGPALALDAAGNLHLAWHESPAGRVGGHRVLYARATEGAHGFDEPLEVSAPHPERHGGARFPSLALDAEGDPHLVWELYPDGRDRPRGLGYAASMDGGRGFTAPVVVPGTQDPAFSVNGGLQGPLARKLAARGSGEVVVVNSAFEPGEASRVRLIRGRPAP